MDRFDVIRFEDLSGPDGGEWIRIGGGSFGVVFKGEYLGTDVAIKEVLPNNTYDVEKYFERECVLLKEARHPNIVQYIGLTKSHGPEGRIYIISEFVGGNVRSYIADKRKPFDWRLRISFATDIARAVAYLHARNCMHRDLKGENLLITENQRIKVCDFGFARIAARNQHEMRRLSFCGTDGYMSPEILMGVDFSLPSDVFSLGIIFCEIASRRLVDSHTFSRSMPTFTLDEDEVRRMADKGCPEDFVQLCLDMCEGQPDLRPTMKDVVIRLRGIEREIINREALSGTLNNIGSVRASSLAATAGSRANYNARNKGNKANQRLPSFDGAVQVGRNSDQSNMSHFLDASDASSSSSDDTDIDEALAQLENLHIAKDSIKLAKQYKANGHGNPWWADASEGPPPLPSAWAQQVQAPNRDEPTPTSTIRFHRNEVAELNKQLQGDNKYSTCVVRSNKPRSRTPLMASMSRIAGAEASSSLEGPMASTASIARHRSPLAEVFSPTENGQAEKSKELGELDEQKADNGTPPSYMTARMQPSKHLEGAERGHHGVEASLAYATISSTSSITAPGDLLYHRFTLVKNGTRRPVPEKADGRNRSGSGNKNLAAPVTRVPYQLMLANAITKCSVCNRRLGFNPYMDCDDCPYKTHVDCAEQAEPNCQELEIPQGTNDADLEAQSGHRRGRRASLGFGKSSNDNVPSGAPKVEQNAVANLRKRFSGSAEPKSQLAASPKAERVRSPPRR